MISYILRGMEYKNVTLLPGPFKKQRDETMALYSRCPAIDDILLPFRKKAGIPSDAQGMPGWGQSIGQYLGACAKWWRNTGDGEVRQRALSLFEGWRECAEKDSRVLDMGTYPYEKLLGGLCDMIEYMDFEEAVPWMRRLTERAAENFDPDIPRDGLQDERMKGQIEWYTLPENLYRAWQLTGDEIYREFAGRWLYPYVWVCCTGTFPQDTAEYANMIAYTDPEGLYISQLIPAGITFEKGGERLTLVSDGAFPFRGEGRFTLHAAAPVRFRLRIRVPHWADGENTVRVNGEVQFSSALPDTWLTLDRTWRDGDRVEADFPYRLRFSQVDPQHRDVCALMWGPVAMCCDEMTVLVGDRDHPGDWIHPVEGMENVFETLPGHSGIYSHICRRFYPYWQIGLMKWYYMYNRLYPDMETLDREHQGF